MLNDEAKIRWEHYFSDQATELNIPDEQRNVFIQAGLFGINKYSLALMKRLAKYGDDLTNTLDGDNWITDSSIRMFIQILEPPDDAQRTGI